MGSSHLLLFPFLLRIIIIVVVVVIINPKSRLLTTPVIKNFMTHSFIPIRSRRGTHLLCHVTDGSQWSQGWEPVDKMVCASTQHQHSDLVLAMWTK